MYIIHIYYPHVKGKRKECKSFSHRFVHKQSLVVFNFGSILLRLMNTCKNIFLQKFQFKKSEGPER